MVIDVYYLLKSSENTKQSSLCDPIKKNLFCCFFGLGGGGVLKQIVVVFVIVG